MSLRLAFLNTALRLGEKRRLARVTDPVTLRRMADRKARFWLRLPRDIKHRRETAGALDWHWITAPGAIEARVILYLHGGAYVFGSVQTHGALLGQLSRATGCAVVMPDYRLAPENPCPAALEDALAAYAALRDAGYAAQEIVIGGDSAGGGLALALLGQLIAQGRAMPAGVFVFSPLTDMAFQSPSLQENARRDVLLPVERARDCADYYLAGQDARDPRASPIHADMRGAPPVYVAVSSVEILRDDSLRMADHLRAEGVAVTVEQHDSAPHAWPVFQGLIPEARNTVDRVAEWITSLWSKAAES